MTDNIIDILRFLIRIIGIVGLGLLIFWGTSVVVQDMQIPSKTKRINQVGVEVYCSEVASDFARNSYNDQWGGGDPEKGQWIELTEKVYTDCINNNNK